MSDSTPRNCQKLLTEPIGPHYIGTCNLQIQNLIFNSIELLGSLKHVIIVTSLIRYMGCYSAPGHIACTLCRRVG
jgi:hypothetical protein